MRWKRGATLAPPILVRRATCDVLREELPAVLLGERRATRHFRLGLGLQLVPSVAQGRRDQFVPGHRGSRDFDRLVPRRELDAGLGEFRLEPLDCDAALKGLDARSAGHAGRTRAERTSENLLELRVAAGLDPGIDLRLARRLTLVSLFPGREGAGDFVAQDVRQTALGEGEERDRR